jgi:uncharacterized protein
MPILLGFIIAVFIALTGVGAGSLTTPLLILLLGMPAKECVGTALIFGAVVKLVTVPTYMARGQINKRALLYMVGTGLPGVLGGALLLHSVPTTLITGILGVTIVVTASINLFRFGQVTRRDRTPWLAAVGFPIGVEMGFSSAGAGAIGALALMGLTTMGSAEVVGTDLSFGLGLSIVGGGIHAALGSVNTAVLWKLLFGGVPGAIAGSYLAGRLPSKKLRFALCLALVVIGAQLTWKSLADYRASSVAAASSGAAEAGQSVKK